MRPLGHFGGLLLSALGVLRNLLERGEESSHELFEHRAMTLVWSLFGKSDYV